MSVVPGTADLLGQRSRDLDRLFRSAAAGQVPDGDGEGTVLIMSGTWLGRALARILHAIAWQGKVFDRRASILRNKVSPLRVHAIRAAVYPGPSLVDGKECIILDYSRTSWVARWVRDEIRMVAPGRYLGVVFLRRRRTIGFALTFSEGADDRSGDRPSRTG